MSMPIKFLAAAVLMVAPQVQASTLVNPGFELNSLTGWNAVANGGSAAPVSFHDGSVDDGSGTFNVTATGFHYTPQPGYGSFFLAIQAGTTDQAVTVSQTLTLAAGDSLVGWAAFDWADYYNTAGTLYLDGASVRILDAGNAVVATPFTKQGASSEDTADYPWTSWNWTALTGGTYTLEFSAINTGNDGFGGSEGIYSSYGLFDVQLIPIPEPETYALMLAGLGLVGFAARRRRV